jgi:hypothetical protein
MLAASQGWGKTMMIQMIALREQMFERGRRTLIIVPDKNVGNQYESKRLWVPERDWVGAVYFLMVAASAFVSLWLVAPTLLLGLLVWRRYAAHPLPVVNLCGDDSSQTIIQVKEFFLDGDGTMVCCMASASRAWGDLMTSEMGADALSKAVKDISVWFDECQFAKGGERRDRNKLGDLIHAMVRGHGSVKVGLVSATPFRADGVIVHPDDAARFEKGTYRCPFDRHLAENMLSTEYMEFDWCAYDGVGGWQDDLAEYVRNKGKRMLIYIPGVNTVASGGKFEDYDMADAAI